MLDKEGNPIPVPDYAVFSDTGWEPATVYKNLTWLKSEVHKLSKGKLKIETTRANEFSRVHADKKWRIQDNIADGTNSTGQKFVSIPAYIHTKNANGRDVGITRRQCTREYKIDPLAAKMRRLMGLGYRQRMPKDAWIECWIGISSDEIVRMRDAREPWQKNRWPLIDMFWSRDDCKSWFDQHYPGRVLPRSACIGCPLHNNAEWADMKRDDPESFREAVRVDKLLRENPEISSKGELYLHEDLQPLDEVDFDRKKDKGLFSMLDECHGMCGN